MANPASQDDGLIIFSDDMTSSPVLTQEAPASSPVKTDTNVIDFSLGEPSISSASPEISPVTISRPAQGASQAPSFALDNSLDFSFDLGNTQSPATTSQSTPVETAPLSQVDISPSITETSVASQVEVQQPQASKELPLSEDTDMDIILDGTIGQLKKRQEVIGQVKAKKSWRITDLSRQIEELQQQVADLKDDVTDLEDEDKRISTNIASLESMKMFEKTQEEEKVREHNLKKVGKK